MIQGRSMSNKSFTLTLPQNIGLDTKMNKEFFR